MMNSIGALLAIIVTLLGVAIDGYHCKVVQFIFGDSLSDVGNNNYLSKSLAKANLPWYGIDFGTGLPNGRFSNGRTVADIIGDQMGLPRPPAFLDQSLTEDVILDNGVNYASGGAGILNETGGLFIQKLSLYKQIELFQGTQELIKARIGEAEAKKFFQNSRYVVALGSNDFINNYLMPIYSDSWTYTQQGFITYIMETLQAQLTVRGQEAHGVWARPYGLHPTSKGLKYIRTVPRKTNKLALSFNQAASNLVNQLSSKLPNASFQFGDAYDVVNDVIINPHKYGFNNSDSPCCSFGKIRPALTCIPASTLCKDRSKYVFWDEYHPSDKANELIANELIRKLGFLSDNNTNGPSPAPAISPSSNE